MSGAPGDGPGTRGPRRTALDVRIASFDARVDRALEPWRGRRAVGALFRTATRVGDFSLVWQIIGLVVGLAIDRDWRHTAWFAGLIAAESLVVNQGVKRLFRRTRPTTTGDARFQVRRPTTSSFPSGHASAGFFAATLLSAWVGWPTAPIWFLIAIVVAGSRAFVRIHHPSDVVAGAAFGLAIGVLALAVGAGRLLGA
jgi:membrane-associated phospholipid phosphatase